MSRIFRNFLSAGFCLFLIPQLIIAGVTDTKTIPRRAESEELLQINPQLQLARQLMSSGDYQTAADILETLYESYPDNTIIANSLKSCYEQLKQYAKGELLLRRLSEQFPTNISYRLNLAENLIYQDKTEEGKKLYRSMLSDFNPQDPARFTNVVRSMIMVGLEEDALEVISSLRTSSSDSTLMALERAKILEGRRKYADAAKEYVAVLSDSSHISNIAEKNLTELLKFPESEQITEKILAQNINVDSKGSILKILSAYYLKTRRYEEAFEFAVRQDSATGFDGTSLIEYLRGCMERKLYNQAIKMCEYVRANIKDKPYVSHFHYSYAEALEELGYYDKAIAAYDTIIATFPGRREKAEAAYRIGAIYLNRLNDPKVALKYFDSVKTNYVAGFGYNYAVMAVPHAYLQMGDLENARKEFESISKKRTNAETVEEADYYLALIDFFEHDYDSTSAALKKLTVDFPKGFLINDAIQLSFTIDQAEDDKKLLDYYSQAMQFQEMKLYDSTVSRLNSIADADNKALADIALFRLSEIVLKRGDSAGAVGYVERLANEHPESYFLPFGLRINADLLLTKKESTAEAREIYRKLLENYQNYPFINEVREKLRRLEAPTEPS